MLAGSLAPRDITVESGGVLLAVRDYGGTREPPPLLLLHGSGDTLATWSEVAPLLKPSFRVVAYDAPGHGRSEAPRDAHSPSRFLDVVDDVVAALRLDRPILVGHSMGGVIALLHAAERRVVRAVVSVDGAYAREAADPPRVFPSEEEIRKAGFGRTVSEQELDRMCEALPTYPARASLRRVDALPTRFPKVELTWLDCGHMIPWERPRELSTLIREFSHRA